METEEQQEGAPFESGDEPDAGDQGEQTGGQEEAGESSGGGEQQQ